MGPILPCDARDVLQRGHVPPQEPQGDMGSVAAGEQDSCVAAVRQVWEHEFTGGYPEHLPYVGDFTDIFQL